MIKRRNNYEENHASYTLATMSGLCLVGGAAVLSYKE
jgi:hypothetical protein